MLLLLLLLLLLGTGVDAEWVAVRDTETLGASIMAAECAADIHHIETANAPSTDLFGSFHYIVHEQAKSMVAIQVGPTLSLSLSLSLSFSVSLTQRCLVALLLRPQCNHYLAVPSLRLFGRRWSLSGCFTEFYLVFFFDDLPVCNHYRVLPSLRLRWSLNGCFTEFYLVFFLRRPSTLDQSISRVN